MSAAEAQRIELDVTGFAHGGTGVARLDGRVVFVAGAVPGERVVAQVSARSRSFWRADVVEVLSPSPDRVPHVWPEADVDRAPERRAGGAELGHIALPAQRALKTGVLLDSLRRFGGIERDVSVEAVPGDDERNGLGWRTRVRLHVGDGGAVGPYALRSRTVVPVASLPLAAPGLAAIAPRSSSARPGAAIDLVAPSAGDPAVVPRRAGTVVERSGGREYAVDADGFWQVHDRAADTIGGAVTTLLDPELLDAGAWNLDLYGGVGLLAGWLASLGGPETTVTSVEGSTSASALAARNLADLPNAGVAAGRVDRWLAGALSEADASARARLAAGTLVLDPPRAGAGAAVVEAILQAAPAQIAYVACDPVALARDLAGLTAGGYRVTAMRAFDLFPHTAHLETIAVLAREG